MYRDIARFLTILSQHNTLQEMITPALSQSLFYLMPPLYLASYTIQHACMQSYFSQTIKEWSNPPQ